jgi:2-amino-4-hydroxy-6-hydroxymethyldihydropteridine diphosphokinase
MRLTAEMDTVLVALGSNLGDRQAILDQAITGLKSLPHTQVRAVSSYHQTTPIGGPPGQGEFLNAAARLETTFGPADFHSRLVELEQQAGRTRRVRWGERTLDLDVIMFEDQIIEMPALIVPHPRFFTRRFVLEPLAEIAADSIDPKTGRAIGDLLSTLDRRAVALPGWGAAAERLASAVPENWRVEAETLKASFAVAPISVALPGVPREVPILWVDSTFVEPAAELRAACEAAT